MATKIRRVFHIFHPMCYIYELIKDKSGGGKVMTLYSLVCDKEERVAKQAREHIITDCNFKFGINKLSKICTFKDIKGEEVELYILIADPANSVRGRTEIDDYIGKWSTIRSVTTTPEAKAVEWITKLKEKNAWNLFDFLALEGENLNENFENIITNGKVVDPT